MRLVRREEISIYNCIPMKVIDGTQDLIGVTLKKTDLTSTNDSRTEFLLVEAGPIAVLLGDRHPGSVSSQSERFPRRWRESLSSPNCIPRESI